MSSSYSNPPDEISLTRETDAQPVFVDVFAGCGGLSLGLMQAGWNGLFAIEKDPFAFDTLSTNLLGDTARHSFRWPTWLPKEPLCAIEACSKYEESFARLAGTVDLLVGGPPCQGYSCAGRRDPNDPRNQLFATYLRLVDLLKPKLVLLENVRGITLDFEDVNAPAGRVNYVEQLVNAFSKEYVITHRMLNLSTFGVPQNRSRFFLIGIRKDHFISPQLPTDPFDHIEAARLRFLRLKGLTAPLAAKAAISDLETSRNGTNPSTETPGFRSIAYKGPITPFQHMLRNGVEGTPTDMRLANHRPEIVNRFREIISSCHADGRLNVSLSREARESYGLKKQAIRVLDPCRPAPTVTSMPDDLLHYSEPRTLTVRENARLQSFPDWFEFCGTYTTGGHRRRMQVPRFTQVANAIPPLVAEAVGLSLLAYAVPAASEAASCTTSTASSISTPRIDARLSNVSR